ncbi:hypothetical protein AALO_G00206690 [Alosa alosa]|uniref:Uncharacterized protein n=1 Tax=Alosa alosa TaxID=278164 RepID=A0AAV6G8N9_9TELE|nr:hypothetical protein AALO_G00206690 [Alosa alosa]
MAKQARHSCSSGSLPKWVVNKSSQFLAPKAMKRIYICRWHAGVEVAPSAHKPWLYPEQNSLPSMPLSELRIQHADSLENIDESSLAETKEEH